MFHRRLWAVLAALSLQSVALADDPAAAKRFGDVTEARVLAEAESGANWLVNGGRFSGEHFSPLKQITAGNVDQLGLAWFADIDSFTLVAEPIVVDGVIYLSGSLAHSSYETEDGQRRYRTEVHASEVVFLDSRNGERNGEENGHVDAEAAAARHAVAAGVDPF